MEAKIVDPDTGEALRPGQKGELWLRGPSIMHGSNVAFLLFLFFLCMHWQCVVTCLCSVYILLDMIS